MKDPVKLTNDVKQNSQGSLIKQQLPQSNLTKQRKKITGSYTKINLLNGFVPVIPLFNSCTKPTGLLTVIWEFELVVFNSLAKPQLRGVDEYTVCIAKEKPLLIHEDHYQWPDIENTRNYYCFNN